MYNSNLHFFFVGIGGSGMSGIAEILLARGFRVSGSDLYETSITRRLSALGAVIYYGHDSKNLQSDVSLLVYSSAISESNPEIKEARLRAIPVVQRAEVLAELMRFKFGVAVAGSHGKTTTTSMLGWIMEQAGLDPTVVVGGQVRSLGSGGRSGLGAYLVAEADESDRSFLLYRPTIAIVTNVDLEHLSAYRDADHLYSSFEQFVESVPFYGLAVLCADDPFLFDLAKRYQRRKLLYGFSQQAELRAEICSISPVGVDYNVIFKDKLQFSAHLPMIGRHFALNSLAAIAVAKEFGVSDKIICEGLKTYPGVERRLESYGEFRGVKVYNDYGHHPVEIKATLKALKECYKAKNAVSEQPCRIVVVFQPHRYSRTEECYPEFCTAFTDSDYLIMTEIYAAGESPREGISGENLAHNIKHGAVHYKKELADALQLASEIVEEGDVLLLLGAGTIGRQEQVVKELLVSRGAHHSMSGCHQL